MPFRVPWQPGGMSTDDDYHETYLSKFKNSLLFKLQTMIKKSLEDEPELKSRKKIVEVSVSVWHTNLKFNEAIFYCKLSIHVKRICP